MAKSLSEKLKEIEKIYSMLQRPFDSSAFKATEEYASTINSLYLEALRAQKEYNSELDTSLVGLAEIANEISKFSQGIKKSQKGIRDLSSIQQKLTDYVRGYNKLSTKDLQNLKEKAKAEQERLKSNQQILSSELNAAQNRQKEIDKEISQLEQKRKSSAGLSSEEKKRLRNLNKEGLSNLQLQEDLENTHRNIQHALDGQNASFDSLNRELEEAVKHSKLVGKNMGLSGAAVDGLSTALDKLGLGKLSETLGLDKAKKAMEDMAEENALEGTTDRMGVFKAGIKSIGQSFKDNLTDPAFLLVGFIKQLFDALKLSDKGAGDLAKNFNMSYGEANATRQELSQMAALSGDVALNTKGLQESLVAVGNSLGSNASLNEKDLKTFTKLREQAGYTNDELIGIQKISLVNGKTLEDNTKEVLGGAKAYAMQKGLMINEKQILRDISKTSDAIKLSLGNSTDELAKAAVEARAVGLNLEQADKIASGLLEFESSIAAELEAELLLGKDINLEKARQLALDNDLAGAAKEIASQVGNSADFAKMSRIQQEALAKSVNMSRDELAKMLMDQEALEKLSAKEGESAQQAFNRLVKEVGMEEAKKRLGDEQLATQFEQQSVQERFQQGVMKLQELFIQIAEPILAIVSPLADLVGTILPAVNILLQPIMYAFSFVAETIKLAVEGAGKLLGIFTGTTKELGFWESILGALVIAMGTVKAYTLAVSTYSKIAASFAAFRAASEQSIIKSLAVQGIQMLANLGRAIATAVAQITGASAATLGVAAAIALAAGGAAYAFLNSKKGNDILSPGKGKGGYGDRVLFGPEGAIQLNNKDTVIAGTDLFADDMVSAPKGEIKVANSTSPSPTPKEEPKFDSMRYVGEQISTFKDKLQVTTMVGIQ